MPVLYSLPFSGPCRSVIMLADVMGLKLETKNVDLLNGEHLKPEYLKINHHHTIPTLVDDDGFTLFESRAILGYLVNRYAPTSGLYPQDPKKRALVDRALYYDASTLGPTMGNIIYPVVRGGAKLDQNNVKTLDDKLALLNEDLAHTPYLAGDELTIADLATLATWTSIEAVGLWKTDHLTNIQNWMKRIKESGKIKNYDELVVNTSKFYGDWIKEKLHAA